MTAEVEWPVWSTTAVLHVADAPQLPRARDAVLPVLDDIERAASRFRPDSELSRLNGARGRPTHVGATFAGLLGDALRVAHETEGAVDPTVGGALVALGYDRSFSHGLSAPSRVLRAQAARWEDITFDAARRRVRLRPGVRLDLGAAAKAAAVDRGAAAATEAAGCGVLFGIGGDLTVGGDPPADGWVVRVARDHRGSDDDPGQTIMLTTGALATSSTTTRRWYRGITEVHHIVDPSTRMPAREVWRTVTVAAATCVDANAASTAAVVWGERAVSRLEQWRLPARLERTDGEIETVGAWPEEPSCGI